MGEGLPVPDELVLRLVTRDMGDHKGIAFAVNDEPVATVHSVLPDKVSVAQKATEEVR